MAIALDVAGTGKQFGGTSGVTGVTYTGITVGAGSNRALIVGFYLDISTDESPVVTWDSGGTNQNAPRITGLAVNAARFVYMFGLVAPTSGNKTLKVTWNASTVSGYVNAIAWTGVDQTGGTTSFNNPQTAASGGATPVAITTTGTASDASVTCLGCDGGVHRTSSTATSWWADSSGPGGNVYGDEQLGVGSISDAIDGTHQASLIGVTIKAAAAGGGSPLRFNANLDGLGASGGFFRDPLAGRSQTGWRPSLILLPRKSILRPSIERIAA